MDKLIFGGENVDGRSRLTEFEELYMNVQRRVSSEWQRRLDKHVSGSQAMILWMLEYKGPQKSSVLAERLCITPGAITSLSDKLIKSGYAIRERDKDDRRVVHLKITEKGRDILSYYRLEIKQAIEHLFTGLPEEDIEHLIRIYRKVLENIEKQ